MMIDPEHLLVATFGYGMVAGLLIATGIVSLYWQVERHLDQRAHTICEKTVLNAVEEAAIEIDEDKMLCATCWQERHPGELWYFGRRTPCIEHFLEEGKPAIATERAEDQTYALQH